MSLHFDFVDLRLFVCIAEENSLTKAANRIHISLPAASMRIKKIEQSIGIQLLNRTATGIVLLPSGHTFLHHARQVLAQTELLRSDMQEYAQGIKGHVRILANTTATTEFLPAVLSRFLALRPNVNIDLSEKPSAEIASAVASGATDIGIVADSVSTEGLHCIPYKNDKLVLICSPDHPLAQKTEVAFEEVIDENFITLHEGSAIHGFLQDAAKQLNQQIKIRIQVSGFDSMCRMVSANVGIGMLPDSAARRYEQHIAIKRVAIQDAWSNRRLVVCVRELSSLPHFTLELIEHLKADSAYPNEVNQSLIS